MKRIAILLVLTAVVGGVLWGQSPTKSQIDATALKQRIKDCDGYMSKFFTGDKRMQDTVLIACKYGWENGRLYGINVGLGKVKYEK